MADVSALRQELNRTEDQVSRQKKQLLSTVEDIDALILELKQVQETFWAVSKRSNIGARQFNDKMEDVISTLRKVSHLIEDTN